MAYLVAQRFHVVLRVFFPVLVVGIALVPPRQVRFARNVRWHISIRCAPFLSAVNADTEIFAVDGDAQPVHDKCAHTEAGKRRLLHRARENRDALIELKAERLLVVRKTIAVSAKVAVQPYVAGQKRNLLATNQLSVTNGAHDQRVNMCPLEKPAVVNCHVLPKGRTQHNRKPLGLLRKLSHSFRRNARPKHDLVVFDREGRSSGQFERSLFVVKGKIVNDGVHDRIYLYPTSSSSMISRNDSGAT